MFSRSRRQGFFWISAVFFLFTAVPQSTSAAAQSPLSVIQSGTEKAVGILHSSGAGQSPALRQRKGELLAIVDEYFNFEEMG